MSRLEMQVASEVPKHSFHFHIIQSLIDAVKIAKTNWFGSFFTCCYNANLVEELRKIRSEVSLKNDISKVEKAIGLIGADELRSEKFQNEISSSINGFLKKCNRNSPEITALNNLLMACSSFNEFHEGDESGNQKAGRAISMQNVVAGLQVIPRC